MDETEILDRMRDDWNSRAAEDANYYVAFGRRNQDEDEFFATAAPVVRWLERDLPRLSCRDAALEIGCGPGRGEVAGAGPPAAFLPRRRARNRLWAGPPDAAPQPSLPRDSRSGRLRHHDRSGARTPAAHAQRLSAPQLRLRSFALPKREVRFRVFLRRLPAHSQPRGGVSLPARGAPRA